MVLMDRPILPILMGTVPNWGRAFRQRNAIAARSIEEMCAMTTRLSLFNSPLLLGFDHFERTLDRVSKASADGYPPYNIEQIGPDQLRITVAVAGFTSQDLSVQTENNQLLIRGRQSDDDKDRVYLHRGIAARQFQRSFVLADGIEVTGASTDNGLLHVDLKRPLAETRVKTVEIKTAAKTSSGAKALDLTQD
jgi:HSP20 family molecular chaperone IbpA